MPKKLWIILLIPLIFTFVFRYAESKMPQNNQRKKPSRPRQSSSLLSNKAAALVNVTKEEPTTVPWEDYGFVFIAGYHFSGTSVTERLFSTQSWATGFESENEKKAKPPFGTLEHCLRPNCRAPEREGYFLTQVLERMYTEAGCILRYWADSGECAAIRSAVAEKKIGVNSTLGTGMELWKDWSRFWVDCKKKQTSRFLIEKDIDNLYISRFLQEVFGAERSSFIFVLRHPFAHDVSYLKTPEKAAHRLRFWVEGYEIAFSDAKHLKRWAAFQYERLADSPKEVLAELSVLISQDNNPLSFDFDDNRQEPRRRLNLQSGSGDGRVSLNSPRRSAAKEASFTQALRDQPGISLALNPYQNRLRRFCYSAEALKPLREEQRCSTLLLGHRRDEAPMMRNSRELKCEWDVATDVH